MKKECKVKCCRLLLILILGIFFGMLMTTLNCFSVSKDCCVMLLLFGIIIAFIFFVYCSECNNCEDSSKDFTNINKAIQEAIATEIKVISEKAKSDLVQAYMNSYIPKDGNEKELLALFNFIKCNVKSKEIGTDKVVEILRILNDGCDGKSNGVQGSNTETGTSTPVK